MDEASQRAPGAKRLPNFVTNPPKQGNSSECGFGKFPGHMVDPADRARQMQREAAQSSKSAIKYDAWRPGSSHSKNFISNRLLYGEQCKKEDQKRAGQAFAYESLRPKHESPWRVNNPYKRGQISRFIGDKLEYIPEPDVDGLYRPQTSQGEWHYAKQYRSKPSPAISMMLRNMKAAERHITTFD